MAQTASNAGAAQLFVPGDAFIHIPRNPVRRSYSARIGPKIVKQRREACNIAHSEGCGSVRMAADIRDLSSRFLVPQKTDDLLGRDSRLPHRPSLMRAEKIAESAS